MPLNRIDKPNWQPFFDRVSAALGAKSVGIDIVAPGVGNGVVDDGGARHRLTLVDPLLLPPR